MCPFLLLGAVPYLVLSHYGEGPPNSFQTQLVFFYIQLGFSVLRGSWGPLSFYSNLLPQHGGSQRNVPLLSSDWEPP